MPREHAAKWPLVVKAMEQQFQPPVREPLDLIKVLRLAEEDVTVVGCENLSSLSALASLCAYLGDADGTLRWCEHTLSVFANLGRAPAEWELQMAAFCRQLRNAVELGGARDYLREAINGPPA